MLMLMQLIVWTEYDVQADFILKEEVIDINMVDSLLCTAWSMSTSTCHPYTNQVPSHIITDIKQNVLHWSLETVSSVDNTWRLEGPEIPHVHMCIQYSYP
jgi:hypothetical protein